jgi:proline iminopeptidase
MYLFAKTLIQALILVLPVLAIHNNVSAQNIESDNKNFTTVNGAKLWYETEGTGEPLLLIPGGPGLSHIYFKPHVSKLADRFKIIYFDAFGRGKSERAKSPGEYTFQRDVDDIEGLRKSLGIDKFNIYGHSYGGIVAQAYILKHPEHVDKLVLSNTLFSSKMFQAVIDNMNNEIQNQYPEVWEMLKAIRSRDQKSGSIEYFVTSSPVSMQLAYFYDVSNMTKLQGDQFSFNPDVFFALAGDDPGFVAGGDLGNFDFRGQLKDVKVPSMIIAGRFDRGCLPSYTLEFKNHMPQAKFVMFEKSGHFPFIEEPQEFCDTLNGFLSK